MKRAAEQQKKTKKGNQEKGSTGPRGGPICTIGAPKWPLDIHWSSASGGITGGSLALVIFPSFRTQSEIVLFTLRESRQLFDRVGAPRLMSHFRELEPITPCNQGKLLIAWDTLLQYLLHVANSGLTSLLARSKFCNERTMRLSAVGWLKVCQEKNC